MLSGRESVDDDQPTAAAWTGQCEDPGMMIGVASICVTGVFPAWRFGPERLPDPGDIGRAVAVSVEAVVADAMLAFGQDMHQEPADELVDLQGHGCVSACAIQAVVLDLEGHAARIEPDQATVGNRDAVGVA